MNTLTDYFNLVIQINFKIRILNKYESWPARWKNYNVKDNLVIEVW